ncbi:His-Xaa-Ser system protein HxsD [Mucilaginibacter angelicae]|uniref:His-Xaa-Ser system protein HxsD n=1 Tax=Mucilaginibacter angelicae TaxID=869718 RepID=A0ABV6L1C5_9SPHI
MIYKNHVAGNEIIVYADTALYSKDAVFKCLYWYGDKFHTSVTSVDAYYQITLTAAAGQIKEVSELDLYLQKLERDLVDFNLRDIVTKETQNVRDLLIAKAFSNGEYDELPPGEISDPVGYDVKL